MPSTSKKQHNFMAAIAHNPAFAKKVGIPQSVGKDFDEADKGKKFGSGGRTRPDVQKVNKSKTDHGKMTFFKEGGNTMASKMNPGFMAMMAKKKGAPAKKMAGGGMAMGKVKTGAPSRDGIAEKGKTKGKMVAMKMGGKAC
jgi:predicted methyltransferase